MTSIIALVSKLEPLLKHWRTILAIAAAICIVICCMTHCSGRKSTEQPSVEKTYINQPIPIKAVRIPEAKFDVPPQIVPIWTSVDMPIISGNDSVAELLIAVEWLQNQLYGCDSAYRWDTNVRTYEDVIKTDSFELGYLFSVAGVLKEYPAFDVKPLFPITTINPRPNKAIYLEGSLGPRFSYGRPVALRAVGGSLGLGYTDSKGWSYGVRGGASQLDWNLELAFRKSFFLK